MEKLDEIDGDEHCDNCLYEDTHDGDEPCKTCVTYDFPIKWEKK